MKAAQIAVVLVPMLVHLLKKEQACLYLARGFLRKDGARDYFDAAHWAVRLFYRAD